MIINKQIQSNLSRISLKGQVQAKLLLKLVEIHQKWSEFWLTFQYMKFSENKTFRSPANYFQKNRVKRERDKKKLTSRRSS